MAADVEQNSQFSELCRICTTKTTAGSAINIFETEGIIRQISKKISICLPIKVNKTDDFPKKICGQCLIKLDLFWDFRNRSAESENFFAQLFKEYLQECTSAKAYNDSQPSFIVPVNHNQIVVVQQHQILNEDSLLLNRIGQREDMIKQEIILTHDNVDMNPQLQSHQFSDNFRPQCDLDVNMADVNSGNDIEITINDINCFTVQQSEEDSLQLKIECDETKLEGNNPHLVDPHLNEAQIHDNYNKEMDLVIESLKQEKSDDEHSLLVGEQLNSAPSTVRDKQVFNTKDGETNNKRQFYCNCGKAYEQQEQFDVHCQSHFSKCSICSTVFINEEVLEAHKKEVHDICKEDPKGLTETSKEINETSQSLQTVEIEESVESTKNKHYKDKKTFCLYCERDIHNFARHIATWHKFKTEVQHILSFKCKSKERRYAISALAKRGNYMRNRISSQLRPVKRVESVNPSTNKDFLPCPHCMGFYKKKWLDRHTKKCSRRTELFNVKKQSTQSDRQAAVSYFVIQTNY